MKNMTLGNIAKACHGTLIEGNAELEIEDVVTDSRQVREKDLFLAIKGEHVDGHRFIPQVMKAHAAAVVCERKPEEESGPYILVENVLQALQDMALFYRNTLKIPLIGVTGSVGKTSSKEFIASVINEKFHVLKTEGNYNNEIGVPLTLLKIREDHEAAVIEMGINHFGEMRRLGHMVRPDIMVFTNIGDCHLEFLGTRDGILRAKTEVFEEMDEASCVIINGDDDKLTGISEVHGKRPIRFGFSESNDFYADHMTAEGLYGSHVRIQIPGDEFEVMVPLPGEHMVRNALAATAVGIQLGLSIEEIAAGISHAKSTGGRSNIIQTEKYTLIDDCYNANPASMCAAIDLLIQADTRKVAILGDMFELGSNSDLMHAKIGRYAVEKGIDVLICVGEASLEMAKEAEEAENGIPGSGKKEIHYYPDKEKMIDELPELLSRGDTILIKASHGMEFQKIVNMLKDGNDEAEVREGFNRK